MLCLRHFYRQRITQLKRILQYAREEISTLEPAAAVPTAQPGAEIGQQLRNLTYNTGKSAAGTVRLHGGEWRGGGEFGGVLSFGRYVAGDLDGDGRPEYAVILWYNSGGSGVFPLLALVKNVNGRLLNLDTLPPIGDRIKINRMWIERGRLNMDVVEHGPDDPMCCPSRRALHQFAVRNGKWKMLR